MQIRQLKYQARVLNTLERYIDALSSSASSRHFTQEAWQLLKREGQLPRSRADIPFSPRADGCGRPVPNVVFKVPTGGGKTWLAVCALSRILGRYFLTNTGLVLWIVPNEAIYTQTLRHLRDRQHPYRQALERSAAGRVQIMEKGDRLDARDVHSKLCVMILMLQSANRETKDSLKIFQDRGDVHGFFPPEGEQLAHRLALEGTPNLSVYEGPFPMVKDSLGNALRILRPVVVLDEGHRAVSPLAFRTLYGFNPSFVLELSATPQDVLERGGKSPREARHANLLVEVTGQELDREGMIKMPLNLDARQGSDWRATLGLALTRLQDLQRDASAFQQERSGRYIRPIMLVQVERTGADQRERGFIHADEVKAWLLNAGLDEAEVAVKTAEQNDLRAPENQDLLAPTNRVRVIITKQALREGWDCPFAYLLCALAASSNHKAMTQLVGRILRQPYGLKTGVASLDECHVITHRSETATVVKAIKGGLEREGLGDVMLRVGEEAVSEKGKRRPESASIEKDTKRERDLHDYDTIDWRGFDPKQIVDALVNRQGASKPLEVIALELQATTPVSTRSEAKPFDPTHCVRMLADLVPNAFVAREIVGRTLEQLRAAGFDELKLGRASAHITQELRSGLRHERSRRAEAILNARD